MSRRGIALPYVDDIIIPAKDEKEAVSNLNEVISTCSEYGLELNLLGHIIENKTISLTPQKIDAVSKFKTPQNLMQLESFPGLTGYPELCSDFETLD